MLEKREEDEVLALERTAKSRWRNKERFEREHAGTLFTGTYPLGTLVLVRNSPVKKELDRKHKPRWLGPFVVVRRTKGGSYVLTEENGAILLSRFAAFRVIRYHLREGLSFKLEDFVDRQDVEALDKRLIEEERGEEEMSKENQEGGGGEDESTEEEGDLEAPLGAAVPAIPLLSIEPLPQLDSILPANVRPTRKFLGVVPPKLILKRVVRDEDETGGREERRKK